MTRDVRGVSVHGQMLAAVGEQEHERGRRDQREADDEGRGSDRRRDGDVARGQRPRIGRAVPVPQDRHEDRRDQVEDQPREERDVLVVELLPVEDRGRGHEPRECRDRQEAEGVPAPAAAHDQADEEVRPRDVAPAHHQRRHRRPDGPGEQPVRVVREQVQNGEGDDQERRDQRPDDPRLPQDAIVSHGPPSSMPRRWVPRPGMLVAGDRAGPRRQVEAVRPAIVRATIAASSPTPNRVDDLRVRRKWVPMKKSPSTTVLAPST